MPTGSRRRERGFTFLGLLLILVVMGAALAALGTAWSSAAWSERERELRFRGDQIAAALGRYHHAHDPPEWPQSLDDLLEDRRGETPRHHLRRLWTDPFTGHADWVLVPPPPAADGQPVPGFAAVRSRSDAPRRGGGGVTASGVNLHPVVSDWIFKAVDSAAAPAAASAPKKADANGP